MSTLDRPRNSTLDEVNKHESQNQITTFQTNTNSDLDIRENALDNIIEEGYIQVVALKAGQSFGELALISHKPRAATIRCREKTKFAILDKKGYQKIFEKYQKK